jgi:hypothetical protein
MGGLIITFCISLFIIKYARRGWQDENGFHEGTKKINDIKP